MQSNTHNAAILKALYGQLRLQNGSLVELAKRCKMSRQNLHHYFLGKQHLQADTIILHASAILAEYKERSKSSLIALQTVVNAL